MNENNTQFTTAIFISCAARPSCLEPGVDYIGHDTGAAVNAADPVDCQHQCAISAVCRFFTFRHSVSECWLKTRKNVGSKLNSDLTSGPAQCSGKQSTRQSTPVSSTVLDSTEPPGNRHARRNKSSGTGGTTALLMLCYNRPKYLKRAFDAVNQHLPSTVTNPGQLSRASMPFYVSQDGNHARVTSTIHSFIAGNKDWNIVHLHHKQKHVHGDDHLGWVIERTRLEYVFGLFFVGAVNFPSWVVIQNSLGDDLIQVPQAGAALRLGLRNHFQRPEYLQHPGAGG